MYIRSLGLLLLSTSLYPAAQVESKPAYQFAFVLNKDVPGSHPVYALNKECFSVSLSSDKKIAIYHMNKNFFVYDGDKVVPVTPDCLDKELRSLDIERLNNVLQEANIQVTLRENGAYVLKLSPCLRGGGLWGARIGFYVGRVGTHLIGHGIIFVASSAAAAAATAVGGPGAGAAAFWHSEKTLTTAFLPKIEAASRVAGLAGGIIGGTMTGPA